MCARVKCKPPGLNWMCIIYSNIYPFINEAQINRKQPFLAFDTICSKFCNVVWSCKKTNQKAKNSTIIEQVRLGWQSNVLFTLKNWRQKTNRRQINQQIRSHAPTSENQKYTRKRIYLIQRIYYFIILFENNKHHWY